MSSTDINGIPQYIDSPDSKCRDMKRPKLFRSSTEDSRMTENEGTDNKSFKQDTLTSYKGFNEGFEKKNQKKFAAKLNQVAAKGNVVEFKKLYDADKRRLRFKDSKGNTPAHKAAEHGQLSILRLIDAEENDGGSIFNIQDKRGNTALHAAVRTEQTASIEFLLDHGADSNITNNETMAPVHYAVELNCKKSLKIRERAYSWRNKSRKVDILTNTSVIDTTLLCHSRVDVNCRGEKGQSALHYCAQKDRHECAKILLECGAKPCQKCDNGYFPINVAGKCASAKTLEILIKHVEALGYNKEDVLSYSDKENNMPLHCAVNSGDIKAVEVCLQAGAPIDAKQEDNSTPLHFACTQGSADMIEMMFKLQPDKFMKAIQIQDVLKMTPLHRAALFDHVNVVEFLLKHGADIDAQDSHDRTPLLLASSKGGWRTVHSLLKAGANIGIKDKENRNFMHLAIRYGMPVDRFGCAVIKNLKNLLNERDDFGCTPLHYASKEGHLVAIDDLIKLGATINPKDNDKKSPLHFAARYGRFNTCRLLLESAMGPNIINETDGDGLTALHLAAQNGHTKILKLLMQKGAYVTKDNNDNTPLHLASENGYTKSMKILLTVYPNLLDTQNKEGQTSLHMAAKTGQASAVELLMDLGASFKNNKEEDTYMDIIIRERHTEVAFAVIRHNRWDETLDLESREYITPLNGLVQFLPDVCLAALDRCHTTSCQGRRSLNFCVRFNFKYLQCPSRYLKKKDVEFMPMLALNTMVRFGRVQCLSHTVSEAFLNMKWRAYGSWFHIANLIVYAVYLGLLTSIVTSFIYPFNQPLIQNNTSSPSSVHAANSEPQYIPVPTVNQTSQNVSHSTSNQSNYRERNLTETPTSNYDNQARIDKLFKLSVSQIFCIYGVLVISALNMMKEIVQILQQRKKYFRELTNAVEWVLYISSMLYLAPILRSEMTEWQWIFGTVAVFLAWFNCLLYLQRFDFFGIYVVMFLEILRTLLQVLLVFSILLIAFGMAFFMLLKQEEDRAFSSPGLSLLRTAMMMLELDFVASFSEPYTDNDPSTLYFGGSTIFLLVVFVLLMPILLMNLLIGLAVGDIESVQKNATLKRLAMQVELHTDLERKLPTALLNWVDKSEFTYFPNRYTSHLYKLWADWASFGTPAETADLGVDHHQQHLYDELYKQKVRMREMGSSLQKQYDLLRLIVQKMEIHTEDDNKDEGCCPDSMDELSKHTKWNRSRQALVRQGALVAHWKNSMGE